MRSFASKFMVIIVFLILGIYSFSYAQDVAGFPPMPETSVTSVPEEPFVFFYDDVNARVIPSVLFNYWEQVAIRDARNSRGKVRAPSKYEVDKALNSKAPLQKVKPPAEERDISLGGIVYASDNEWTIWLNGERVTPTAIPQEIIDLRVYNEYIELKWFDDYSNQIFPIRLKPHQRFNIDTRIFLPG